MKKALFVLLLGAAVLALVMAGTASAAAKWNIKFGHDQPEKSPHHALPPRPDEPAEADAVKNSGRGRRKGA